jgi:hypothetical protein
VGAVEFLKPSIVKVLITLIMPAPIAYLVTFNVESILSFYGWLLTPMYKVWADVMYTEFNVWVLAWVPMYLVSCTLVYLVKRLR